MIIKQEENKIFSTGQVIETGISLEDVTHLKTLFSGGLYKDKYSFIAEMVQNATDVHKLIGTDKLVEVYFDRDEMGDYLAIQDFGTGISPKLMENVISKFGASTKRDSDLFHGGKGIGN